MVTKLISDVASTTLILDLSNFGFEESKKSLSNRLWVHKEEQTPLLPGRHLQAGLMYDKDHVEKSDAHFA